MKGQKGGQRDLLIARKIQNKKKKESSVYHLRDAFFFLFLLGMPFYKEKRVGKKQENELEEEEQLNPSPFGTVQERLIQSKQIIVEVHETVVAASSEKKTQEQNVLKSIEEEEQKSSIFQWDEILDTIAEEQEQLEQLHQEAESLSFDEDEKIVDVLVEQTSNWFEEPISKEEMLPLIHYYNDWVQHHPLVEEVNEVKEDTLIVEAEVEAKKTESSFDPMEQNRFQKEQSAIRKVIDQVQLSMKEQQSHLKEVSEKIKKGPGSIDKSFLQVRFLDQAAAQNLMLLTLISKAPLSKPNKLFLQGLFLSRMMRYSRRAVVEEHRQSIDLKPVDFSLELQSIQANIDCAQAMTSHALSEIRQMRKAVVDLVYSYQEELPEYVSFLKQLDQMEDTVKENEHQLSEMEQGVSYQKEKNYQLQRD